VPRRKPCNDAVMVYAPGGRESVYLPSAPVVADREAFVVRLVAMTVAPGRLAPVASRTTPVIADSGWTAAEAIGSKPNVANARTNHNRRIIVCSWLRRSYVWVQTLSSTTVGRE
jgi:hypothetical protein